ncbi:MAG: carbohydrate kinase [Verrucomicrobia bacterium]|nr:carbohydrate kinase [Verrucomicrobiota bacterium]
MNKLRILSCGEVLWDLFPDGVRFGGAPANFACHAAILGGAVTMLSAVGNDERGDEAISILKGFGINSSLVQRIADAQTGSVSVSLDAAGKPSFKIHADSAWDHIAWTEALEERIAGVNAIYFGTLGLRGATSRATMQRALGIAKAHGIVRVLDVNLRRPFYDASLIRESIARASVLKLSDDELSAIILACCVTPETMPEDTLRALLTQFGLDLVVMTRGAHGALLVTADATVDQPGILTDVVDTVGAGDSFTAALVLGLLRGEPYPTVLRQACEVAASVCSRSGAVPDLQASPIQVSPTYEGSTTKDTRSENPHQTINNPN